MTVTKNNNIIPSIHSNETKISLSTLAFVRIFLFFVVIAIFSFSKNIKAQTLLNQSSQNFASSKLLKNINEQSPNLLPTNHLEYSQSQTQDNTAPRLYSKIVPGFVDIPMHEKLTYKEDDVTIFDSSDGIIHETRTFSTTASKEEIIDFYLDALPPLGWVFSAKTEDKLEFIRDQEFLWIGIYQAQNGGLIVDFFQVPDSLGGDDNIDLP